MTTRPAIPLREIDTADDQGEHELNGIAEPKRLFAVVD
jgi:hypothetical protein